MLRLFDGQPAWVAVISAGRPGMVPHYRDPEDPAFIGEATWYVPNDEWREYKKWGALKFGAGDTLVGARNAALEDAFKRNIPCIQLSDDMKRVRHHDGTTTTEASFGAAAAGVMRQLEMSDVRLAGVAPTDNPYFSDGGSKTSHFIVGDFIIVKPSTPRFDPNLRVKEDYDFTLQHYFEYGGVLRCDSWLAAFQHRSNPGGAVAYRTEAVEQEAIAYLKARWPGWIKDNPRRPNEVLMKLPRRQRSTL